MIEQPFLFQRDAHQLFGVLHQPTHTNNKGFVLCPPFAEEMLWAHRVCLNFARTLTLKGYTVLRFDYMGHGDSSGDFENSDIKSRVEDIGAAVRQLKDTNPLLNHVGLIGLRFGASLAALVADERNDIDSLVLWEPINKGAQYMKELIRINLSTQTAVYKEIRHNTKDLVAQLKTGATINIDGYEIKYPLYEQMNEIVLAEKKSQYQNPVLVIQINKREGMGTKRVEGLSMRYHEATRIEVVEQPFWKEIKQYYTHAKNLFSETITWIDTNA